MEDLAKVSSIRLYKLWRNLTVGLLSIVAMLTIVKMLPPYLSPIVSLLCAAALYTYIYENKAKQDNSCQIVPFAFLYSLVIYSFISISINMLNAWGVEHIPFELVFFTNPYIPSLILCPVCFFTLVYLNLNRRALRICMSCKSIRSGEYESEASGINRHEAHLQLKNLIGLFGFLSIVIWGYYLVFYVNINVNDRDWYIFTWTIVICVLLDELYFIIRYYNLYLDLKENDEIITPEQLNDISAKTYLRYYVICGNNLYVDSHTIDPKTPYKEVIDTPFFTKRSVNGISVSEVKSIIKKMVGFDGELRFFYGRRSSEISNHNILRYFYFLDGDVSNYLQLNTDGEWMDFEKIKYLYANNPGRLSPITVSDTSRLATIILTEKIFNENGYRKSKIKMYNPSFNLLDVRKSSLDFQDDKWIKISLFNSDTPFYSLKRRWRLMLGDQSI